GEGLGFFADSPAAGYSEFGVKGAGAGTAVADTINIAVYTPPTTTTTAAATTTTAAATTTTAAATTTTAAATTTTAAATTTTVAATTTTIAATTTTAAATTTTVAVTTTTTTTAAPVRPVPFTDNFDAYTLGTPLDTQSPAGQPTMKWAASNVILTNSPVNSTALSAALTAVDSSAVQTFNDDKTAVWTDMYVQPVFGDTAGLTNPPLESAFAFYVDASSNVVAYSGGTTQTVSTGVASDQMTRFTVYSDHTAKTWDLYVDGTQVGFALPFFFDGASNDTYNELGILYGDSDTPATVDDINVTLITPFPSSGTMLLFK
ncbi:MAG: hypothetical protein HN919_19240, partial [Verrucomicrobia bacterium]|nr:hypothetical protein [Verrucomicrobiota bacterium]